MPECYIRGSTIKYLRIPDEVVDMVKEEVGLQRKSFSDSSETHSSTWFDSNA